MKTTIKAQQEKPFPKLMVRGDMIVLMLDETGRGLLLGQDWCYIDGCNSETKTAWIIEDFKDFHGTITLEND